MDVLVYTRGKVRTYNCFTFQRGLVQIGVPVDQGQNQAFRVSYELDDSLEQGDWFRLAILTHTHALALRPDQKFDPKEIHSISGTARLACSARNEQNNVVKDVLSFLCHAKLAGDDPVTRLSVLCSVAGTAGEVDRALTVLCEKHHYDPPVIRIDQLPQKPGDEPSYQVPNLWEGLRALERIKAL